MPEFLNEIYVWNLILLTGKGICEIYFLPLQIRPPVWTLIAAYFYNSNTKYTLANMS